MHIMVGVKSLADMLTGIRYLLGLYLMWLGFRGFLVFWNPHSPLFEISWCVLLYTTVLVLEFAPDLFERLNKPAVAKAIHSICIPVVFAAVILSTLHQSTLGTLYLAMPDRLHPLWYSPLLPHLFYISSIGQGLATAILVWLIGSKIFGRKQVEVNLLDGLAKASIWVWVLYLVLKFGDLLFQGKLGMVFAFDRASIWFVIEVIVGVVAPVVLFALPNVRQSQGGLFWTSILVTLGTFLSRFNATLTGQMVVEGATYSPHWMEHAIQVGVLAAAVIAWYLLSDYLALFKDGGAAAEHWTTRRGKSNLNNMAYPCLERTSSLSSIPVTRRGFRKSLRLENPVDSPAGFSTFLAIVCPIVFLTDQIAARIIQHGSNYCARGFNS